MQIYRLYSSSSAAAASGFISKKQLCSVTGVTQAIRYFSGQTFGSGRKTVSVRNALGSSTVSSTRNVKAMAAATETSAPASVTGTDHKLIKLREVLSTIDDGKSVDAFIIPSEDPHMSEYPPECDARREFISGFDGSAGTAVVTKDCAALWTDGRYFLQAETQLGPDWTLMKAGVPGVPQINDWLVTSLPEGARVAIDPSLHTIEAAEKLQKVLDISGKYLVALSPDSNPVDKVWGIERPARPSAPLRIHDMKWAGKTPAEKIQDARKEMNESGAGALVATMLDEIAWLLNLRGGDVSFNPVFLSYVIITNDEAFLYVDENKITSEIADHLKEAGVQIRKYEKTFEDIASIASKGVKIMMDPSKVSYAIKTAAVEAAAAAGIDSAIVTKEADVSGAVSPSRKRSRKANGSSPVSLESAARAVIVEKPSPIYQAKGVKNSAELEGMEEAHLRDGVALAKLLCMLDREIASGNKTMTECEIDEELTALRAAQPGFFEPSFPTIAGAGPNGAIIHYRPMEGSCRTVDSNTMLLLDSGGQYDCGTTDVTRTMHMGTPSEHQRQCFTAVLQGHIALDMARWPEGTPGCALDTLTRLPLWKMGLNYRHGTGHGVGAALNVHEGPQSISARFGNTQALLPDMVCSNEPGYYEDGSFGVRIENLFQIVEAQTPFRFAGQSYYTCKRLTMIPLQKKLIVKEQLSEEEIDWVNSYHEEVFAKIGSRLEKEGTEEELNWLKDACSPL